MFLIETLSEVVSNEIENILKLAFSLFLFPSVYFSNRFLQLITIRFAIHQSFLSQLDKKKY